MGSLCLTRKTLDRFGPLRGGVLFFGISILLLGLSRLGLVFWHLERVHAVAGVWAVLGYGLRMDLLRLSMVAAVPVLLILLLSGRGFLRHLLQLLCALGFSR